MKSVPPPNDTAPKPYSTRVEQTLPDLFAVAPGLIPKDELPQSVWGVAVRASERDAYEQTCPCQTPRQIQAFALGLKRLFAANASKSTKPKKGTSHE